MHYHGAITHPFLNFPNLSNENVKLNPIFSFEMMLPFNMIILMYIEMLFSSNCAQSSVHNSGNSVHFKVIVYVKWILF